MGKKLTVLIVDDSMLARAMMKKAVSNYNPDWKIITANNAVEGLTAYHEHKPHIGIIDFNMPGMNGWEFLENYCELSPEQKRQMTLVMLTTSRNPDDEEKAKSIEEVFAIDQKVRSFIKQGKIWNQSFCYWF